MNLENLTDEELRQAAAGEAKRVLEQRRRQREDQRRQRRQQQRRARRRQDALDAVRALDDETLQRVADDPRTAGSPGRERRLWATLPRWGEATKGDIVEAARDELAARRQRAERERARQPEGGEAWILGRPLPLWVGGVILVLAIVGLVYIWRQG